MDNQCGQNQNKIAQKAQVSCQIDCEQDIFAFIQDNNNYHTKSSMQIINNLAAQAIKWDPNEQNSGINKLGRKIRKPPKPLTAFCFYQIDARCKKRRQQQSEIFGAGENIKLLEKNWRLLSTKQKQKYYKIEDIALRKYHIIEDQYNKLCGSKKILNPYHRFFKKKHMEYKAASNLQMSNKEITRIIAQQWKKLPYQQRNQLQLQYEEDKEEAEREIRQDKIPLHDKILSYEAKLKQYIKNITEIKLDIVRENKLLEDNIEGIQNLLKKQSQAKKIRKEKDQGKKIKERDQQIMRFRRNEKIIQAMQEEQIRMLRAQKVQTFMQTPVKNLYIQKSSQQKSLLKTATTLINKKNEEKKQSPDQVEISEHKNNLKEDSDSQSISIAIVGQ